MVGSSDITDREWGISGKNIEDIMEALQVADQLSTDNVLQTLKLLKVKILNNKMATSLCQKVTDTIVDYLRTMKPQGELEELCTGILTALGFQSPGIVIFKLWDRWHNNLPPNCLLIAVGRLIFFQGCPDSEGRARIRNQASWTQSIKFPALRLGCSPPWHTVLKALVISVRKHLDLGTKEDEIMDITQEAASLKAYLTLRLLFNRWSLKSNNKVTEQALVITGHLFFLMPPSKLKNQVNRLTRWLMTLISAKVVPFYISQCICQLTEALALSGYGGINLESQLENIIGMLFEQNHSLALRSFYNLIQLYNDQVIPLIRKNMQTSDPAKIVSALQVFMHVFQEVPQTEQLQSEVMHSVIIMIQEDLKPVQKALLNFIEMLGQHDYLALPQGNFIINYVIRLSESDCSNEEDIQILCSKILQMVSLPKLITLACQPSNTLAFVLLSKTATKMALRARSRGQVPYLSSFHLSPTQFISPQKLLTHLVVLSVKPYREGEFGVSSLRLLYALHPITSLHPIINSSVGQLWMKKIPQMLQILDDHTEKNLNQEEWEDRLLQFSSQSLVAIDDDSWLEQLIKVVLERINYFSDDEEKAFLYKFFGFTLRTSRNMKLIKMMISSILQTVHEELQEREGIAVALSIVSMKHLKIVLDQLQVYSAVLTDKDSSFILKLMKEHQRREWGLVCNIIYLSYSKIILESKGDIFTHLDGILAMVLQHYHNCIMEKDKNLKLEYLDALTKLTNILSSHPMAFQFKFPQKLEIVTFMMELIREEPLNSISSSIRLKAMNIIIDFRKLHPLMELEERTELLRTCYKSVLCLPSTEVLQKEASSLQEAQATVDLFRETLQSLLRLMETLIVEMPSRIQHCLELLDTWLNSQKDNERERAMWCAARILGFTAKMNNFGMDIEFSRLGRLVRLLALRCQDPVDNICFLSAQAVYSLYCILLLQKQMGRKKQGLWEEEGKNEVYSANVFYNNTFEIAKAFAEYFTKMQLTTLVLTAMEGLTDSRAKVSLAAAQLMSAVMKERGRDMIKIEEVVEGILERLNSQLEPNTKEETVRAMCLLAGNNTHTVVPMLLNKTLPWDRTNLALWKAFGNQRETTISVLQLLIGILERLHSKEETKEMAFQPVAVTCALYEMLSGSLCQEAVQELYPRLLLAILCHLYWVIEQNVPQKMVVYSKEGGPGSKSKPFDPTSCALEVVKLVFSAAAYDGVVVYGDQHCCWDLLSCPRFYYIGIMDLTSNSWLPVFHPSGIVKTCEPAILHRILNLVRSLLYSSSYHWKILARAFYAQLLWHRSVAQTLGQDLLVNLIKWVKEPNLIMKEVGLRGISNLALHPGQAESLKGQVPFLKDLLKNEARVTVQAVKSLRNIICHGKGEDIKVVFCSISKQLCPLINDERDQVKISATSALSHMLRHIDKFKPRLTTRREIYTFLVPLLLSIQDNNTEVVKACGRALTEWTNVIGWSSLTQTFRHITLSDHIQVLEETCKYLVNTSKTQLVGDLLFQSFGFLKSSQSFLRAAAINFIALTVKKLNMSQIHEDDVELLQNAIGNLRNDPVESIQSLVNTTLKKIDEYINFRSISTSRMSQISNNILKVTGIKNPERKKRLFRSVKRERDDDNQKIWRWLQSPLNSLRNRYSGRVKDIPHKLGNSDKQSTGSQVPTSESPPTEAGPAAK
ncbi:maestro heat-like repeat-containing protein family member 1 isoform X6 [Canis lupus familiaris]|uniref:maestro heat-like repeat-containing protein family member 1 isoform X6 n=1 Tax=Canis lupus familiaris TaxID=9615 RepID=UPI0018F69D5E|nr:maestro heat-like repeat-containing protein family member 1 isoform X6 [Canis lupus familiaris]